MKSFEESIAPIIQGAKDQGFKAGQQSKQAEIDELQARVDEVLDYVGDDFTDYYTGVMIESIHEILKGTTNEQ